MTCAKSRRGRFPKGCFACGGKEVASGCGKRGEGPERDKGGGKEGGDIKLS